MKPTIYFLNEKEVHMFGDYVGVVWNLRIQRQKFKGEDGLIHISESKVRGKPYIDFIIISQEGNKDPWEEPYEGGLYLNDAIKVSKELKEAIRYLRDYLVPLA